MAVTDAAASAYVLAPGHVTCVVLDARSKTTAPVFEASCACSGRTQFGMYIALVMSATAL